MPSKNNLWLHGIIETLYDTFFIKVRLNEKPSEYKVHNDFKIDKGINIDLIKNIDTAIKSTYLINGVGNKFKKAFKSAHNHVHMYRYDPNGIKRRICQFADLFIKFGISNFFYDETELYKLERYKNDFHKRWHNVWRNDDEVPIYSTQSFDDIYNEALDTTIKIINRIENVIKTEKFDKEFFLNSIPNRSAITGLECDRKLSFIKFNKTSGDLI